jgi:hypothetical protein
MEANLPNPTQPPKDALGNELREGDLVTMLPTQILVLRVMKVDNGGIQTPQGITPGMVLIGVTLTLRVIPGAPILNIAKVVNPGSDEVVKRLLEN